MESWYFSLLGGVSVRSHSRQLEDLVGKKAGALLALLALAPGRMRSREEVIYLIWPEVELDEARNRFRQVLTRLRKQLEPEGVAAGSVLVADRTQIGLAVGHKSDVAEFQQSLRSAAVATDSCARAQHLQAALDLYQGEFAPGFYLDVLLIERERLATLAQNAREKLAALGAAEPLPAPLKPITLSGEPMARLVQVIPNAFFGRQSERERLALLLQESRLVTLLGPGGTGKTRLVQELHADTDIQGAHFVSLSSLRSGASIPDTIVSALALPDSNEAALTRIQAAFADKPTLLILDNVEQLVESGGPVAIVTLLEAIPTLRLLVTSRSKLNLAAERIFPLSPLPEEDAVALFCERAHRARPDFALTDQNTDAVAELCRRLDGLPLAIELAAARSAVLSSAQILERLSRRFDLLTDRQRDRDERHASLRAALDWGWCLIAPDVQQFFSQLCVFRGSFSLEAAEAITGEFLAIDYLQSLTDASFIVVEGERFRLLETLREYGLEKLGKDDSDALIRVHADYFLARATEWRPLLDGSEFAATMGRFKQEQDNITAALDRTLVADPDRAIALCLAVARFWRYAFWYRLAIPYFVRVLALAEKRNISGELLALLHQALGHAYEFVDEYVTARIYHQKHYAYQCFQREERVRAGDEEGALQPLKRSIAGALNNLGNLFYGEGQLDEAQQHYHEALTINRAIGNEDWEARNLYGLYLVCRRRGLSSDDADERVIFLELAQEYAQKGVAICRRLQLNYHLSYQLQAQASLLSLLGQQDRALPLMAEGFALSGTLEHWQTVCRFLVCYEYQAVQERRWEEAAQLQGSVQSLRQRWDVGMLYDDQHLRPQVNLPELLGQERYDLLYQAGFHASLDSLKTLATRMHEAPERQRQVHEPKNAAGAKIIPSFFQ